METLKQSVDQTLENPQMPVWKWVLLWISVLPGALLGSTIVFCIAKSFIWFFSPYDGEETWLYILFNQFLLNVACGYSLVCCGAFIAPSRKITVAIVLASLVLFLSGIPVAINIRDHRWMDLFRIGSLLAGAIMCAVFIAKGEQKV